MTVFYRAPDHYRLSMPSHKQSLIVDRVAMTTSDDATKRAVRIKLDALSALLQTAESRFNALNEALGEIPREVSFAVDFPPADKGAPRLGLTLTPALDRPAWASRLPDAEVRVSSTPKEYTLTSPTRRLVIDRNTGLLVSDQRIGPGGQVTAEQRLISVDKAALPEAVFTPTTSEIKEQKLSSEQYAAFAKRLDEVLSEAILASEAKYWPRLDAQQRARLERLARQRLVNYLKKHEFSNFDREVEPFDRGGKACAGIRGFLKKQAPERKRPSPAELANRLAEETLPALDEGIAQIVSEEKERLGQLVRRQAMVTTQVQNELLEMHLRVTLTATRQVARSQLKRALDAAIRRCFADESG